MVAVNERVQRWLLKRAEDGGAVPVAAAWFAAQGLGRTARREFRPALLERAIAFGYLPWARKLLPRVKGRDVLDVGCGSGMHGIAFLLAGATSYTGVDRGLDLERRKAKHMGKRGKGGLRKKDDFGWSPAQVMAELPRVRFVKGSVEDLPADARFDVAILKNVTEHLADPHATFAAIAARLRSGARLIFRHHNYYCWNGHHRPPRYVQHIDRGDADQQRVLDWAHLEERALGDPYIERAAVNRIRLDELRAITERHFTIERWKEYLSDRSQGADRLTEAVLARFPVHSRRELATQGVLCVARAR